MDYCFKGKDKRISIVYHENENEEKYTAWEKLKILLPVLQEKEPGGDYHVTIDETPIYFKKVSKEQWFKNEIRLAITGGYDSDKDISGEKDLYARCFLMLQPYEYSYSDSRHENKGLPG